MSNSTFSSSSAIPSVLITTDEYDKLRDSSSRLIKERALMHAVVSGKSYKNIKPTRTKLWSVGANSVSSVNTALSVGTNVAFGTSNFPDVTAMVGLYDEVRFLSGTLHYLFLAATPGTLYNAPAACAVAFDANIGAPSSVTQVVTNTYHSPPYILNTNSTAVYPNPHRFHSLHFKMPGPLAPVVGNDTVGNAWMTLNNTAAPVLLTLLAYIPPSGTSGSTEFIYYLEFDIELKIRT